MCAFFKAGSAGTFRCQKTLPTQELPALKIPKQGVTLQCMYSQLSSNNNDNLLLCLFLIIFKSRSNLSSYFMPIKQVFKFASNAYALMCFCSDCDNARVPGPSFWRREDPYLPSCPLTAVVHLHKDISTTKRHIHTPFGLIWAFPPISSTI